MKLQEQSGNGGGRTFCLALGAALAAAGALAADLPDPVIWWTMDALEDGKVKDMSGNGWDLTGLGADTYVTNLAAKGNALWFSGTTGSWANRSSQPLLTSRTLSFWIWRSEDPGPLFDPDAKQNTMPTVVNNLSALYVRLNNSWKDSGNHALGIGNYQLVSWYGYGGGLNGRYFGYPSDYPRFTAGAWTHLAWTIDVTNTERPDDATSVHTFNARIYINGEPRYVVTDGVTTNGSASTAMVLGNNSALSGARPFCGALDEFRVFDRALTAEQVKAEFARVPARTARLVARYPLQDFSEADGSGAYTSPVTEGLLAEAGADAYALKLSSSTCPTNGPGDGTRAVHFDGTYGTVGYVPSIPHEFEDFSIACWVNVSTNATLVRVAGQTVNFPRLITWGNRFQMYFRTPLTSRDMQYILPGDGGVKDLNGACLPKGLWQHMVFVQRSTFDAATAARTAHVEAWVNGQRAAQGPELAFGRVADQAFILGNASTAGGTRLLEGDVSDLRIYDGALSAEDIQALYRGAAAVDAGTDFTVNGADATLRGSVAAYGNAVAEAYAGDVAWTQVSGPAAATFARAGNPVTEVALPAEGAYVFRLSATTRAGDVRADEVTATRDDAATVADVPAEDAQARLAMHASLTNGLLLHYPVNAVTNGEPLDAFVEAVSGRRDVSGINWTGTRLDNGVRGYAFRACGPGGICNLSRAFPETQHEASGNWPPVEEWRTVAAWIRHDGSDATPWYAAPWFSVPYTLNLCYGKFGNSNGKSWSADENAGFTIQQFGMSGLQSRMIYDLPYPITDRWTHVCAVVNRHDTSKSRFYVDGTELTATTVACGVYSNDESKFKSSYSNYVGQALGGRMQGGNNPIHIGGLPANASLNGTMTPVMSNETTHAVAYRVFPGAVDDVRVYGRQLAADEIAYLAGHPDVDGNLAPYVGDMAKSVTMSAGNAKALAPETADDGKPSPGALSYEWEVLSGEAAHVSFADKTAAATQVTVARPGTYSFRLKAMDGERVTYGRAIVCEVLQSGTMIMLK